MLSIVDSIIVLCLLTGTVLGFKKGFIKSIVSFVGMILVFILSFYFKSSLAAFLYTHFPFFDIGVPILNILIYEGIAFLLLLALFIAVLRILIKISGLIEMILNFTIVLGIPSKILGAIFGFLEAYLFVFIILFICVQFNIQTALIKESKVASSIIENTPFMSNTLRNSYNAVKEVLNLNAQNENKQSVEKLNQNSLDILLKYKIISVENVKKLIQNNKFKVEDINKIMDKYQ